MILISGTSRGLGSSLYKYFKSKSYDTYSINKRKAGANNFLIDLNDRKINFSSIECTFAKYKKIVFISNASIISPIGKFDKVAIDSNIEDFMYTNYINPAKIIFSIINSEKKFIIINISTGAALSSNQGLSLYSSSKAAKHRFIDIIKIENLHNNNALYVDNFDPGRMKTAMQKKLLDYNDTHESEYSFSDTEDIAKKIFKLIKSAL